MKFKYSLYCRYRSFFNWTATYRNDSDVELSYGKMHPKQIIGSERDLPTNTFVEGKTGLAVWIVSNCDNNPKRWNYIKVDF